MNRIIHGLAFALFVVMAYIQLNDPDPLYWTFVYLLTACCGALSIIGKANRSLILIAIGLGLAGMLISAPGTIDFFTAGDYASIYGEMTGEKPSIESAREFGGLLIAVGYLVFNGRVLHKVD